MTFGPAQLELAIARLEVIPDAAARSAARAALSSVLELHREGLERLLASIRTNIPEGEQILRGAAQDEVVAGLLTLHGLHPLSVEARVRETLEKLGVSDRGARTGVEVISNVGGCIRLRVTGTEALRRKVEQALQDAVPEVERIEVVASMPDLLAPSRLVRKRRPAHERCDLCGEALGAEHAHLFDIERRTLACACAACDVLLGSATANLRRVPPKALRLGDFRIRDTQWEALGVPVALAFFYRSSALGKVIAAYPGPAGAIESVVSDAAWDDLIKSNPVLAQLEPDVAALLVHRHAATPRYWALSIDACYRLTGLVRSRWQGITGGEGAARALEEFFGELGESRP